jgi:TRAP transporter TAXI family solute receptor
MPRARARLLCFFIAAVCVAACGDAAPTFSIATGGPAGLYYPFGGGMASIWSRQLPEVNVKAEVTGGSVTNVIQVARKESELGIAMADVVTDAYLGRGRFPEPLPLRVLFTAYPNIVHILTLEGNGVQSVEDMRGKRISLGAAGSGTAIAAENVLTGLGVELSDVAPAYLSFSETTSALKDGTVDAGFVVGGLGLAAVTELAVSRNLRLVALSGDQLARLERRFPAYSGTVIPAGTYSGVARDVQALGIWSAVVVHPDLPAELAYALTCTIYLNTEALLKVSQVARALSVENIHRLPAVPLHRGTQAYLENPSESCRFPDG